MTEVDHTLHRIVCAKVARASKLAHGLIVQRATTRVKFAATECDMTKRTLCGYGSTWETPATADAEGDIFVRGAFAESIRRHDTGGFRIKLKDAHRRAVGVVTLIREDDLGLYFEAEVEPTPEGDAVLRKVCAGSYDSFSVGFVPLKYAPIETGGVAHQRVDLREISVLGDPSNISAKLIEVKHMPTPCCAACAAKARTKGAAVRDALRVVVEAVITEDPSIDVGDVIEAVAYKANRDAESIEAVFAGDACPDAELVIVVRDLLGVDLTEAAMADGCDGAPTDEPIEEGAETKAAPAPAPAPAGLQPDEMLSMAEALEMQATRLRQVAAAYAEMPDPAEDAAAGDDVEKELANLLGGHTEEAR